MILKYTLILSKSNVKFTQSLLVLYPDDPDELGLGGTTGGVLELAVPVKEDCDSTA